MKRRSEFTAIQHLHQAEQFIQFRDKGGNPGLWWSTKGFLKSDQLAIQAKIQYLDDKARCRKASEEAARTF